MKIRLHYKLFAAILAAIMVIVAYMSMVMQWSVSRGFLQYVSAVEYDRLRRIGTELEEMYARHRGWDWLVADPRNVVALIVDSYPEGERKERLLTRTRGYRHWAGTLPSGPLPEDVPSHFLPRVFLENARHEMVFGFDRGDSRVEQVALHQGSRVIGYLGLHLVRRLEEDQQLVFAKRQQLTLMLIAAAAVLIAAGLTLPITYLLTRPIRTMAAATRSLAAGRYGTRIHTGSQDEFGQLAHNLNDLAAVLEKNQIARSQWIADISHELRTPLAILRGKIEALQDGVYPPSAELYHSLHREVLHLGTLVEDLYQLSLSDSGAMSYRRVEVEPCWALKQAIGMLRPDLEKHGLTLTTSVDLDNDISLVGDNERLQQLFRNLLANSIRYTDPRGRIDVRVCCERGQLLYTFDDSAPGVTDADLVHLFDRLYRIETSRSRELGGAGLGLSICHNIVVAHHGTIVADHSALGGVRVEVRLPCSE
ncbi:MAG: ATP-binding protein [Desulfopila sp.]